MASWARWGAVIFGLMATAPLLADEYDRQVQTLLAERGCEPGVADGQWGRRSSEAMTRLVEAGGAEVERPFDDVDLATLSASDAQCPRPTDPGLRYRQSFKTDIPFVKGINWLNDTYILDVADADGDGAEDFVVSGAANPDWGKKLDSFLVINRPGKGRLETLKLGKEGLTDRTWAGAFFRDSDDGKLFFILGRNGEIHPNFANTGERVSVFEITSDAGKVATKPVFVGEFLSLTASISICDLNQDGIEEILLNNYGSPQARNDSSPSMLRRINGAFVEARTGPELRAVTDKGAHNYMSFADVDGDGACDLMNAFEVAKWGGDRDPTIEAPTYPGVNQSYVLMNRGGGIGGPVIKLPDPHFGDDSSAFSIEMLAEGDRRTVFVVSTRYRNGALGMSGYYAQAYRSADGTLQTMQDVTADVLPEQFDMSGANHVYMRFSDIDSDGDLDIYNSYYSGAVQIYRNTGDGRFRKETLLDDVGYWRAVAFLANPGAACADLVTVGLNSEMRRYDCTSR